MDNDTPLADPGDKESHTDWQGKKHEIESMRILVPLKEVLTPPQIRLLLFIWTNPGMTSAEIQDALAVAKPTLSRHLSRLIHLDLVVEKPDPDDRRKKLYVPVDKASPFILNT